MAFGKYLTFAMSVLIETSLGIIVVDLEVKKVPETCLNFLKLCKIKYYNFNSFHKVEKNFLAQTGDPSATGTGGDSIFGKIYGKGKRYFKAELHPKLKHSQRGTLSMATVKLSSSEASDDYYSGSQFFITLADDLDYLNERCSVFGHVVEGFDVLEKINNAFCDESFKPYQDIRILHTVLLDDPFPDPDGLVCPVSSPILTEEMLGTNRIGHDEEIDPSLPPEQLENILREKAAHAKALTLEMVGDIPYAEIKPPENVLFVCKLNPATRDEDLDLIFSRFGKIVSCEVIRDRKSGESLQYAFIEFDDKKSVEEAYFRMDNVLIDERRIKVDFSQSVSKLHSEWIKSRMRPGTESKGRNLAGFSNLEHRQHYRKNQNTDSKYDMVFDHDQENEKNEKSGGLTRNMGSSVKLKRTGKKELYSPYSKGK